MSDNSSSEMLTIGQAVAILAREFPDVSVSSMRFLEREGLLSPQRKAGGHRLYSPDDLERARRIKQWQAERVPLKEIRHRLERVAQSRQASDIVAEMSNLLLKANDIPGTVRMLEELYDAGMPLMTICNDVLTPVLRSLGDEFGNHLIPVDVQMELDQHLIAFFSRVTVRPENIPGSPVIVAACPPWERHDMPMRMLVALLIERGAAVHYIGAQVDSEFVRDAITRVSPDFVLVSLTVPPPAQAATWFKEIVSTLAPDQHLLIGGIGSSALPIEQGTNVKILGLMPYAATVDLLMSHSISTLD